MSWPWLTTLQTLVLKWAATSTGENGVHASAPALEGPAELADGRKAGPPAHGVPALFDVHHCRRVCPACYRSPGKTLRS